MRSKINMQRIQREGIFSLWKVSTHCLSDRILNTKRTTTNKVAITQNVISLERNPIKKTEEKLTEKIE